MSMCSIHVLVFCIFCLRAVHANNWTHSILSGNATITQENLTLEINSTRAYSTTQLDKNLSNGNKRVCCGSHQPKVAVTQSTTNTPNNSDDISRKTKNETQNQHQRKKDPHNFTDMSVFHEGSLVKALEQIPLKTTPV
ncbi:hypothetical protein EB796_002792 [Bugula neritina]|uniref:Uncharacterized protein n=1 Tax=Bugula neritina TaxID=10212 RepID=A0A7J7KJY5_BUGNE|nr:hypothetical protein EB796_002792 [Bugula neritina]